MFIADVIAFDSESITARFWTSEKVRLSLAPEQIEVLEAARARAKARPDMFRDTFIASSERCETGLALAPWADDEEARKAWLALEPAPPPRQSSTS